VTRRDKVEVGFFSFTEVTDPREHRSYNEWHQLDHLPEQFPLRGIAYGQRWVATPACAAARADAEPPFDATHYVTLYLMTAPLDRTLREFHALGVRLSAAGRFHRHRRSHFAGPLRVTGAAAAARVHVSPAAVPYRPHRGVYVVVGDARDEAPSLDALTARPGVAGAWSFASTDEFTDHPWDTGGRSVTVAWLDDDPLVVARHVADLLPGRRCVYAGPLETIAPWQWDWFDRT
jgi:hypothetical protein